MHSLAPVAGLVAAQQSTAHLKLHCLSYSSLQNAEIPYF